jgi:serine/threonine protein kinase
LLLGVLFIATVALVLAHALQKPDNIGFDGNGILKMFDFGLARSLREEDQDENGLYNLTGLTGGIRYMAPEVGLCKPYNALADVYSWSMLMWYILSLEPPMGFYTTDMFLDRVFQRGTRPSIDEKWPNVFDTLLRDCWSDNISQRPTFKSIAQILQEELVEMRRHTAT